MFRLRAANEHKISNSGWHTKLVEIVNENNLIR